MVIAWVLITFGCVVAILSLVSLYFSVTGFLEKRRNSVKILDAWNLYYRDKRIWVSIPLDIVSNASGPPTLGCVAQLGQETIRLELVRTSLAESLFLRHRYVPEFAAENIEVPEGVAEARVSFGIRLSHGVYKEKDMPIQ